MIDRVNLHAVRGADNSATLVRPLRKAEDGFAGLLEQTLRQATPVKFSAHAAERMRQRGIEFGPETLTRIAEALEEASVKGAREAVLLVENHALVASVPNRTVITVVDLKPGEHTVFTNIDSVVVVAANEAVSHETAKISPLNWNPSL